MFTEHHSWPDLKHTARNLNGIHVKFTVPKTIVCMAAGRKAGCEYSGCCLLGRVDKNWGDKSMYVFLWTVNIPRCNRRVWGKTKKKFCRGGKAVLGEEQKNVSQWQSLHLQNDIGSATTHKIIYAEINIGKHN